MKVIVISWITIGFLALIGVIYASINYGHNPIKMGDDIQITTTNGNATTTMPLLNALITIQSQLANSNRAVLSDEEKLAQAINELEKRVNALEHK